MIWAFWFPTLPNTLGRTGTLMRFHAEISLAGAWEARRRSSSLHREHHSSARRRVFKQTYSLFASPMRLVLRYARSKLIRYHLATSSSRPEVLYVCTLHSSKVPCSSCLWRNRLTSEAGLPLWRYDRLQMVLRHLLHHRYRFPCSGPATGQSEGMDDARPGASYRLCDARLGTTLSCWSLCATTSCHSIFRCPGTGQSVLCCVTDAGCAPTGGEAAGTQ